MSGGYKGGSRKGLEAGTQVGKELPRIWKTFVETRLSTLDQLDRKPSRNTGHGEFSVPGYALFLLNCIPPVRRMRELENSMHIGGALG